MVWPLAELTSSLYHHGNGSPILRACSCGDIWINHALLGSIDGALGHICLTAEPPPALSIHLLEDTSQSCEPGSSALGGADPMGEGAAACRVEMPEVGMPGFCPCSAASACSLGESSRGAGGGQPLSAGR